MTRIEYFGLAFSLDVALLSPGIAGVIKLVEVIVLVSSTLDVTFFLLVALPGSSSW